MVKIVSVSKKNNIISLEERQKISNRYKVVTKAINKEFWDSNSDTSHSFYVGSFGRGTAINTSDIDILVELPKSEYEKYDYQKGNGQSRLLQSVKNAIKNPYPKSDIKADGQVIVIQFSDGMKFEILPAFKEISWFDNTYSYTYPDTNMGGNWRSTNPKKEQEAMKEKNKTTNGLLFDTCKYLREIRDNHFKSYHLSGIVIDSFVYKAIGNWRWLNDGENFTPQPKSYEQILLEYYNENYNIYSEDILGLTAPGSNDVVNSKSSTKCLKKVLDYIQ